MIRIRDLLFGACLVALGAQASFAAPIDPATACRDLITLTGFPVTPTRITSAQFNPSGSTSANGVPLPDHCQVRGVVHERIGSDGFPYGDMFEVRLPAPAIWNGRFMFQGGGGTEGSVPNATGSAGTLSPTLAHGWAVASQNGGHQNNQLPFPLQFALEATAVIDHAYRSIDVTTQTAKFLIKSYYGHKAKRAYFVGCSTGGRQGMVFSQNFPDYYDGIVAGDPVYDLQAIALSEDYGVEAIKAITPTPIPTLPNGNPILYAAFPLEDQTLFRQAHLAACDGLDGTVDGVVDDLAQCEATFDPATFVFPTTGQPLQCTGAKTATCLTPGQIGAAKKIHQGPRNSAGEPIQAPAGAVVKHHPDNTAVGYVFDGGFMAPAGIPSRKIGTPISTPGDLALGLGQIPFLWISPPDPTFNPLLFDFDTDVTRLTPESPLVTTSTSTTLAKFRALGGKIIWYHGLSDPGPPVIGTIVYYEAMAKRNGGLRGAAQFSRLYLIPSMGHCGGGPATDQFDLLTPLVEWVEHGVAPDEIIASGRSFTSAPATRSRPLCPYPQVVRYVGQPGGDLSVASNYACVSPPRGRHDDDRDDDHGRGHDDD